MRRRLFQVNAEQVEWHEVEHFDVSLVYLPLLDPFLQYSTCSPWLARPWAPPWVVTLLFLTRGPCITFRRAIQPIYAIQNFI
jgi:hypothetical protein